MSWRYWKDAFWIGETLPKGRASTESTMVDVGDETITFGTIQWGFLIWTGDGIWCFLSYSVVLVMITFTVIMSISLFLKLNSGLVNSIASARWMSHSGCCSSAVVRSFPSQVAMYAGKKNVVYCFNPLVFVFRFRDLVNPVRQSRS